MKLIRIFFTLFLVMVASSCSKIDNYDGPNAGISGTITDNSTNAALQSEQPNGYRIRLIEDGYPVPLDFWGKADGTFKNTQLFADKYKVIPTQGPFLMPDTQVVNIGGQTIVNFTVTPFMTIKASAPTVVSKSVIVKYTITKPAQISDDIVRCITMAAKVPAVSNSVNDYNVGHDLSGMIYADIASAQFSDTLKNLPSGTLYVRVGGRTSNGQGKYNYSEVFTVTIP